MPFEKTLRFDPDYAGRQGYDDALSRYDLLLMPTLPMKAIKVSPCAPSSLSASMYHQA